MKTIPEHLTQRYLASYQLPPGENQVVLKHTNPDKGMRGLHLRVSRRKKLWYLRRQVNGNPRVNWELGTWPHVTVADAERAAIAMNDDLDEGAVPEEKPEVKIEVQSVQHALDLYLSVKRHVITDRTAQEYRDDIKSLGWASRNIRGITDRMVHDRMNRYVEDGKIPTGIDALETLQRLYIYLMRKGIVNFNPVAHMTTDELWPHHTVNRPVFKEVEHWRDAYIIASEWTTPEVGDHFCFCAFTGLRPWSEAATLKWENVDPDKRTFTILGKHLKVKGAKREKANRPPDLILPITDPLMAILKKRRRHSRETYSDRQRAHVFPAKMGNSKTGHLSASSNDNLIQAIRDHLQYPGKKDGITAYSLRRFYIQQMRPAGIDPQVRYYLTDQSPAALAGIQAVYDRIEFGEDIRAEGEQLAQHLSNLL